MISETLSAIKDIEIYPIITMILFITAFAGMITWTMKIKKEEIARASRLPLEDNNEREFESEASNG